MTTVTRFAPSPTGYLHEGHAFSALFAARQGERFLLRLEDIDPQRCKLHYAAAIEEDLSWLGLRWEKPVRVQSQHMAEYKAALDDLEARGLLYPCFCTRSDIARAGGAPQGDHGPIYPGRCRHLSPAERTKRITAGQAYALRLDVSLSCEKVGQELRWHDRAAGWQAAEPQRLGDVVLARTLRGVHGAPALMPASYHLCVVHDDALQGVTLVTRGQDLFTATHVHRLLQALLALPVPDYHHHPLLRDATGKRLAKRDNALSLRELREQGADPAALIHELEARLPA
jgi:glutamyl-Q tRNA(Asp) synthetase